ncbi:hypothetical protein [Methylocaldum sp. GT1TLB]|jgi:hypothetical protein|uniref:hypothetical protein n=1 Tax=Methylocaldum sp. GT1TLB TaxID=3438965 RepID=UPI003DA0A620
MNISNTLILFIALAICGFGTTAADEGKDESGKGNDRHYLENDWKEKQSREGGKDRQKGTDGYYSEKEWKEKQHRGYRKDWRDDRHDPYFHEHGYTRLDIPPGHYPPPGECRIWYPGRPAGHQPPPGQCHRLRAKVPPGAWLIRHPRDRADHVHVIVYDDYHPGTIRVIGEFDIGTGIFVDLVVDR